MTNEQIEAEFTDLYSCLKLSRDRDDRKAEDYYQARLSELEKIAIVKDIRWGKKAGYMAIKILNL